MTLVLAVMFTSCTAESPETTPESVDISTLDPSEVLTVLENGSSEYTVVRSDYAKGVPLEAAVAVRNAFEEKLGYEMIITSDWYKKGTDPVLPEYEILVGDTNRPESEAALEGLTGSSYIITVINNKIVINGTTEYAILVGVLVVIAIIAITLFRPKIQELWTAIAEGINGL
jgi:Flp pilus assembly pilin Flp